MKKVSEMLQAVFCVGTPQCGAACAAIGAVLAVLLLIVGLWKTLFIAACALIGAFIGGVRSKKNAVRCVINRLFPEKSESAVDTYEDLKNK